MSELRVDFENLNRLFAAMNEVGDQAWDISVYFDEKVCDSSGFGSDACILKLIGDKLPDVAGYFDSARGTFVTRWGDLQEAISYSAHEVDAADGRVDEAFTYYRGGYSPHSNVPTPPAGYTENYHIDDLSGKLVDPEPGSPEYNHNGRFDAAADAWDTARDVINGGIDLLNNVGAGIDRLPEKSLRDVFVYPLSGNYAQIRTNANACGVVKNAMNGWALNFGRLGAKVPAALEGEAALGITTQLSAYGMVMKGIGSGVGAGSHLFDGMADISEKIAVEVEDVLVILGEKILSLSSKVATRLVPGAGWAKLAWDIFWNGWGVVQDIIDDIETVMNIITEVQNLVDSVTNWAEVQRDRLETFHELVDLIDGLPGVSAAVPGLSGLSTDLGAATEALNSGIEFGEDTSTELGDLNDDLGALSGIES